MRTQFRQTQCTQQNREIKVRTTVYCSTPLQLILFWKTFLFFVFVPKVNGKIGETVLSRCSVSQHCAEENLCLKGRY
jgi:hypothetical protein